MIYKIFRFIFLLAVILVVVFIIYILVTLSNIFSPNQIPKENVIDEFKENQSIFVDIVNFMDELDIVSVDKKNKSLIVEKKVDSSFIKIPIKDKKIENNLRFVLFKLKYSRIISNDNDTEFIKQSGFDWSIGIVYCIDKDKLFLSKTYKLENISNKWYYKYDSVN